MDFELTRSENDEQLLSQLALLETAENIRVLIPFAKAYLGMFYVIDAELDAKEKVKLLANEKLANAVLKGFEASLLRTDIASVEAIGHAMAEQKEIAEGYVILAGLDLVASKSNDAVAALNNDLIESAIGFHFSNKMNHRNSWFDYLLAEHKNKVVSGLLKYWLAMLKNNATYLPGRDLVLGEKADAEIIKHTVLPLLQHWQKCKAKVVFQLLQLAFKYAEAEALLKLSEGVLSDNKTINEKVRLYWVATAYLLSPDKYFATLSNYVGRVKLKVMPLLDFVSSIVANEKEMNINISDKLISQLLRMIAPIFPPQHHVYGALGGLDINSRNVMLMFYFLARSKNKDVISEIKLLRKARVMKIYAAVIDNLVELQVRKNNEKNFSFPDFEHYIENLVNNNCLQGRSNKFDLK